MSNPILTSTNSKLDTRVKKPSGVVPPPSGPGSPDRFSITSDLPELQNRIQTFF